MIKRLGLAITFYSILLSLSAKTIYFAPTGKSITKEGGEYRSSYDSPFGFNNLSSSMPTSLVATGDTVYFKGGQYDVKASFTFIQTAGTAERRTYLGSYPGETAIFDFREQPYGDSYRGLKVGVSYVHIYGIVVRYAGDNGMYVSAKNNIIENCSFYGNCDSGLQVSSGDNLIKNCDSYQNFDYKTMSGTSPDYGGNADGFADSKKTVRTGTTNTYIGCRAWENSDDGWDFYAVQGESVIKDSWCFRNGPAEYDLTDFPRYETDKAFLDGFKNIETGKIIVKNYGNGNGFKIGGGTTSGSTTDWAINNIVVTNCVSFENKVKGFDQNNNHGTMTFYNCTGYKNAPNYGFSNATATSLTVQNCISASNKGSDSFKPSAGTKTFNNWNVSPKITVADTDFQNVDLSNAYANRNADGSLPNMNGLFRLSPSSQCIDKGTPIVGLSYTGSAPDLGAFEYSASSGIKQAPQDAFGLYISYEWLNSSEIADIQLCTVSGTTVKDEKNTDKISLQSLTSGVYVIKAINAQGKVVTKKIVK